MGDEPRSDGDIARLGLETAAAVVERMLEMGRAAASGFRVGLPPNIGPLGDSGSARSDEAPDDNPAVDLGALSRRLRADSERLIEQYATWTRALVEGAVGLVEGTSQTTEASGDIAHLGPAAAGTTTTATVWLHVLDGPPAPPGELHATDLVTHTGDAVPGDALRCDPPALVTDAARSSGEIALALDIPAGTAPGLYHGHLLARGLPEVALALRLEVVA